VNNTIFLFIATLFCWGPTWYVIKFQLGIVDPMLSVFYRFLLASIVILVFCFLKKLPLKFTLKEHFIIFILGVLLFNINYVIFYFSNEYLISGFVALCFSSILFMNILNNFIFHRIRPKLITIFGGILGSIGLIAIFYDIIINFELSKNTGYGIFLGIIATYFASLGNLVSAYTSKLNLNVISVTGYGMMYGTLSLLAYLVFMQVDFNFEFSLSYISSLIYLAFFGSVLGFTLYLTLIKKIGVSDAAYIGVIMPLIALFISSIFEGLLWDLNLLIGAILIITGNILILKKN
jgi:drug/metabolite transporter (DMT)-like permease